MVEILRRKRLTVPAAPLIAAGVAVTVAAFFGILPDDVLDTLVSDSGIAALIPAAEPPLGLTARLALMLAAGGGSGLALWYGLYLLIGPRRVRLFGKRDRMLTADIPVLRRADAHPDAPARRPLFAKSDLGTPFLDVRAPVALTLEAAPDSAAEEELVPDPKPMEVAVLPRVPALPPIEADLPTDLDQPLANFDPHAIPDEPLEWFIPMAPTVQSAPLQHDRPQTFAPTERFETFELRPAVPRSDRARPDTDASATIHSLLDRLEKSVAQREPGPDGKAPPPPPHDSLQEALSTLRKLAAR
ncbi:hypothetical protein H5J25_08065 [Sphingomonas aliaeris]|uniref:Uncharacterized protein n=1 Tax=Sphingomonas aliaeris TaxID=2759526 RepID=A0A974NXE5_9SPHN|nr:hypothetical protein [Sphingomonas aliaeris]QQV78562.1 hypothetical protein H5J25_08065 [Sphingomonas aliaeris]